MIMYLSVCDSAENTKKLHVRLAAIVAVGRAQNIRPDSCCTFHSFSTSPLKSCSKAVRACHLAAQKRSDTARVLAVSIIPLLGSRFHIICTHSHTRTHSHPRTHLYRRALTFTLVLTFSGAHSLSLSYSPLQARTHLFGRALTFTLILTFSGANLPLLSYSRSPLQARTHLFGRALTFTLVLTFSGTHST